MELVGLAGVMASALGLALTLYGVFYNGQATRALIESIRQDIQAVHETTRAIQETTRAIQETTRALQETMRAIHEDGQRRHEELLIYLREMDRRHTELMAAIVQRRP